MRGKLIFCFYSLHPIEQTKEGLIENSGDDVQADDENEHIKAIYNHHQPNVPIQSFIILRVSLQSRVGKGQK